MIPTLLYLLFKKLRKIRPIIKQGRNYSGTVIYSYRLLACMLMILLLISIALSAQKQTRNYKIMRKNSEIGWLTIERQTDSNATTITMTSQVKIRFLITYESYSKEISRFTNGKLQHSYYYRKTNGSLKADRHTYLVGSNYEVHENPEKKTLNIPPVAYNTLCMYFQEPVNIKKVYSDNHQRVLDIEKKSDGGYSITSPDGTTNTFYYWHGGCYKVKIDHSFYSAVLYLK